MDSLVYTLLNNALAVTVMAAVVVSLSWIFRRPAVTHCLWLIVILKLIAPAARAAFAPCRLFHSADRIVAGSDVRRSRHRLSDSRGSAVAQCCK